MRFSHNQVVREYKPLRVIYFGGTHDSRRRHCTTCFIIFQSREGSTSFYELKISVLTFLVKKRTSFPGCLFCDNTRKTLKLNLCSRNRPTSRSHSNFQGVIISPLVGLI